MYENMSVWHSSSIALGSGEQGIISRTRSLKVVPGWGKLRGMNGLDPSVGPGKAPQSGGQVGPSKDM